MHKHIFIAGTFDLFHVGHQWLLWQGTSRARKTTIIIARDDTVEKIKGFRPNHTQEQRKQRVETEFQNHPNVDIKIGSPHNSMIQTLIDSQADAIFLGYDQFAPIEAIKSHLPDIHIERCTPYAPEVFKSSHFR